jgi:uncharacterized cupredoxin-like copper-binding protein
MTATLPDTEVQPESSASSEELLILELREEVRRQGKSMRDTQRAFSIFALIAFLLATATLLAVAFKLDNTTNSSGAKGAAKPASSSPAPAPAPALPHGIGVSLREFAVDTSAATAAAGKVTFKVRNTGAAKHEFVVLKTAKPAGSLLKGAEADEAGNVGEIGNVAPGTAKKLTLDLKAGHYALVCNLPGHYKAGQYADFTVR